MQRKRHQAPTLNISCRISSRNSIKLQHNSTVVQKYKIANLIFFVALCYIISPWFFEKFLFFNEFLSATGLLVLLYKRLPLVKTPIYIYLALLIALCIGHCILSILRMDSFYYYLRNTVIMYSMFTFFIGFFCLHYLGRFITAVRGFLRYYISFLLVVPLSNFLFERYGMATIFPALLKDGRKKNGFTSPHFHEYNLCNYIQFVYFLHPIYVLFSSFNISRL